MRKTSNKIEKAEADGAQAIISAIRVCVRVSWFVFDGCVALDRRGGECVLLPYLFLKKNVCPGIVQTADMF
jgi:hypothetical protein